MEQPAREHRGSWGKGWPHLSGSGSGDGSLTQYFTELWALILAHTVVHFQTTKRVLCFKSIAC